MASGRAEAPAPHGPPGRIATSRARAGRGSRGGGSERPGARGRAGGARTDAARRGRRSAPSRSRGPRAAVLREPRAGRDRCDARGDAGGCLLAVDAGRETPEKRHDIRSIARLRARVAGAGRIARAALVPIDSGPQRARGAARHDSVPDEEDTLDGARRPVPRRRRSGPRPAAPGAERRTDRRRGARARAGADRRARRTGRSSCAGARRSGTRGEGADVAGLSRREPLAGLARGTRRRGEQREARTGHPRDPLDGDLRGTLGPPDG